MEKQRPIYCLICLFCLHCLDCLRCCKVCGHWTYPVRQSQEVLTNVKYDFWLNWLFLFSGLQRFEKNPCIYVWIARWKGSYFEGSPTWPFPDDQLGVHLPPSLSLGPHFLMSLASRENRKTEQHVNVSRSTIQRPFRKSVFGSWEYFEMVDRWENLQRVCQNEPKRNSKRLFKCYCKCLRECLMIFAVIRCYALCRYSMCFLMQKEFQVGQEFDF